MEIQYYTKEEKEELLKNFLVIPKKFKKYLNDKENIYWIYKIINIINDKVYVGKTIDLRRRSLDYINDYCKGYQDREINRAISKYGIRSFIITPIEIAFNTKSSSIKEKYYIDLYDSIKNGYNVIMGSGSHNINHCKHTPTNQTLYSKMSKSKIICAINCDIHEMIFSTGLKLFGDYIDRHKDEIKSAAKRQTRIDGYFLYYMNKEDLNSQIYNANKKIEKNSIYSDCNLQYPEFIDYARYILQYLKNKSNTKNFTIKFITQSNDPCGYEFKHIDDFLEYYKTIPNNLI